ncbi:MAG TPA: nitrile hydratase subunit beta [Mycobacterium sp.]|nr:nitrile hydratase subunit beta [Mycobacterium sp.]
MNGVHDMGGMHGFGPIATEVDEPAFHETWEARMFGIAQAMTYPPGMTIDRFRFLRETMPPAAYLMQSYYEHWYFVCASALRQAGMVTIEELRTGRAAAGRSKRTDAMRPADVDRAIRTGDKFSRAVDTSRRFSVGHAVTARNMNPTGHTRLPRYARGKRGLVHRWHGAHVFADASARGDGECPQHLYTVMFTARELWGADAAPADKVYLDLWESYLDPA